MSKGLKRVLIAIAILILIGFVGITIFTGSQVFNGVTNVTSREETINNSKDFLDGIDELDKKYGKSDIYFTPIKGSHTVPGIYFEKEGNKNIAILIHGMGGTKETLGELIEPFIEIGYNVIAYDQRNSGANEAPFNTSGYLESYDALGAVNYAKTMLLPEGKILLWGESYGGITAAIAAGRDDSNIDYLILDCPISDGNRLMDEDLDTIEAEEGIPASYMRFAGDLYSRFRIGMKFSDMDAREWIKKVKVPVLIINASEDKMTPPYMADDLMNAITHDKKELYTAEGYGHCQFAFKETDKYMEILERFLNEY